MAIARMLPASRLAILYVYVVAAFAASVCAPAFGQSGSATFTLDGRLFSDTSSTNPLAEVGVVLKIQILDPAQACVLYEESQSVDTSASNGAFSVQVGSYGTSGSKRTSGDSGNLMATVYSNTVSSVNGKNLSDGSACSYAPASGDQRYVRITVTPPSGSAQILSPNMALDSVPTAVVAETADTLQGLQASQFVQVNSTGSMALTQTNLQTIFNTTNFPRLQTLLSVPPSNYVQSSGNGSLGLPLENGQPSSGLSAGQVWYDTSSNSIKYYNGSSVVALGAAGSGISSLTVGGGLVANGTAGGMLTGPGTIDLSSTGVTAGTYTKVQVDIYGRVTSASQINGGDITYGTIGGSTVLSTTGAITTSGNVTAQNVSANNGSFRYVILNDSGSAPNAATIRAPTTITTPYTLTLPATLGTSSQVLTTDNSGNLSWTTLASSLSPSGTAAGDLAGFYPNPVIAPGAVTTAKIYDNSVSSAKLNSTGIAVNRLVATDATTGTTLTYFTCPLPDQILAWNAGTGWGCTTVASLSPVTSVAGKSGAVTLNAMDIGGLGTGALLDYGTAANQLVQLNGSSQLTLVDGSAAAPSYSFVQSPDTGMYSPFPHSLALAANGTAALMIDGNSGFVGIGTTIPLQALDVTGVMRAGGEELANTGGYLGFNLYFDSGWKYRSSDYGYLLRHDGTGLGFYAAASGTAGSTATVIEPMFLSATGKVGIGTTNPQAILDVHGTGASQSAMIVPRDTIANRPSGINGMIRYATDAGQLEVFANGTWQTLATGASGTGAQTFSGDVTINGAGTVANNASVGGNLSVAGTASFSGGAAIAGGAAIGAYAGVATPPADGLIVSGNVGVGTTNPSYVLDVVGNTRHVGAIGIQKSGGNIFWLTPQTADLLTIGGRGSSPPSSGVINIDTLGGNVGIGTSAPSYKLEAMDTSYLMLGLSRFNANTGGPNIDLLHSRGATVGVNASLLNNDFTGSIGFKGADGTSFVSSARIDGAVDAAPSTGVVPGRLVFNTADASGVMTERMRITSLGNVGIGTTAPAWLLDVTSSSTTNVYSPMSSLQAVPFTTGDSVLRVLNSSGTTNGGAYIALQSSGGGLQQAGYIGSISEGSGYSPDLVFGLRTGVNAYAESMRIAANGKIGIGTTNPSTLLQVAGQIAWGNSPSGILNYSGPNTYIDSANGNTLTLRTNNGSGATERLSIGADGLVGIGTTLPGGALEVYATGAASALIVPRDTQANRPSAAVNGMIRYNTNTAGFEGFANGAWGNLTSGGSGGSQWTNGSGGVIYYSGGNVGIGTSNPVTTFHVYSGNSNIGRIESSSTTSYLGFKASGTTTLPYIGTGGEDLRLNTNGATRVTILSNGDVGIGTASPAQKLEVAGAVRISVPSSAQIIGPSEAASGLPTADSYRILFGDGMNESIPGADYLVFEKTDGNTVNPDGGIAFATRGTDNVQNVRMILTGSGNVGIGTTSPSTAFHVNGNMTLSRSASSPTFYLQTAATLGSEPLIYGQRASGGDLAAPAATGSGQTLLRLLGEGHNGSAYAGRVQILMNTEEDFTATANGTNIRFFTTAVGTTSLTEKMRISSTGNVGVGTTIPRAGLDVATTGTAASALIVPRDTTANRPTAAVNGMLRYNTNTASLEGYVNGGWSAIAGGGAGSYLPLAGGAMTGPILQASGSAGTPSYSFSSSTNTGLYSPATGRLALTSQGTDALTIDGSGNVGIGTTTPTGILEVQGGTAAAAVAGDNIIITAQDGGAGDTFGGNILLRGGAAGTGATTATAGGIIVDTVNDNTMLTVKAVRSGSNYRNAGIVFRGPRSDTADGGSSPKRGYIMLPGRSDTTGGSLVLGANSSTADVTSNSISALRTNNQSMMEITTGATVSFWKLGTEYVRLNDTTSFFASGNVGIGTTSPAARLDVVGSVISRDFGNGGNFAMLRADGTASSPTAVVSDDMLGILTFAGYATGGTYKNSAAIKAMAAEGYTATAYGSYLTFETSSTGTSSRAERMRITSAGNVGIGTTNPSAKLDVTGSSPVSASAAGQLVVNGSETTGAADTGASVTFAGHDGTQSRTWSTIQGLKENATSGDYSGYLRFTTRPNGTIGQERMRITSSGNVGIGTTLPQELLEVAGSIRATSPTQYGGFKLSNGTNTVAQIQGTSGSNDSGLITLYNSGTVKVQLSAGNGINSFFNSGNVGVGTTTPNYKLDVAGDINTSTCFRIGATTVSGSCTSDERLKENIQDYNQGLPELLGIRLRTYQFNGLGEMPKTGETAVGVVAQEVEKTNPDLVKTRLVKMHQEDQEKTEIKVVDYSKFTYMLINAVKELYRKFTGLQRTEAIHDRDLASLKAENAQIKAENAAKAKEIEKLKATDAELRAYLCAKDPNAPICH